MPASAALRPEVRGIDVALDREPHGPLGRVVERVVQDHHLAGRAGRARRGAAAGRAGRTGRAGGGARRAAGSRGAAAAAAGDGGEHERRGAEPQDERRSSSKVFHDRISLNERCATRG